MSKGRGPGVFHSFKQVAEAHEALRVENMRLVAVNEELAKVNQEIRDGKLLLATQTKLEQAQAEVRRLQGASESYRLERDTLVLENAKLREPVVLEVAPEVPA